MASIAPYFATPANLLTFYDARQIRMYASDTGTPIVTGTESTNAVILAMLARATETILQYARVGKKYSETDLQAMADAYLDDNGAVTGFSGSLVALCCDLAYGYLVMRRGTAASDLDRLSPNFKGAQVTLQLLASGEQVFPRITGAQHEDAGTPRAADLTAQTTSPDWSQSWSQQANRALLPRSPLTNNPYGQQGGWGCP